MEHRGRKSYQDLIVWQKAMDLATEVYSITQSFPREEMFGLTTQIRRSASSIASNIAEGYGREHRGDYVRFLCIAQGSLKELETHLFLSHRIGFLKEEDMRRLLQATGQLGKMLHRLIRVLQRSPTP